MFKTIDENIRYLNNSAESQGITDKVQELSKGFADKAEQYNDAFLSEIKSYGVFGYSLYIAMTKLEHWEASARLGVSFKVALRMMEYGAYKYIGIGIIPSPSSKLHQPHLITRTQIMFLHPDFLMFA